MTAPAPAPWAATLGSRSRPPAHDPGGRAVVVSAHPDDEVIALGGWLTTQVGRDLTFVVATDGEASHPGSPTTSPEQLRRLRRVELADALAVLGHRRPVVHHLALRDADLPADEPALVAALRPLLADAALVLTPFEEDGHADHDAVGRVVRGTAPASAAVWRYPVWRWAWTAPGDDTAWLDDAVALPSSGAARDLKAAALAQFRTQVEPLSPDPADQAVVTPALLAHALTAPEVVLP